MDRTYCVCWVIDSLNNIPKFHHTNVKIPYGPINLDRVTGELLKELNKDKSYTPLVKADIMVVSWSLLE